jgi:protein-tyrosine phosphatase
MSESARLDLNWVQQDLAVGGCFSAEAVSILVHNLAIRHVVDTRDDVSDEEQWLRAHQVEYLHLPFAEQGATTTKVLSRGVAWVSSRLERGEGVLIHCEHGVGRSVLLGLCVMVRAGMAPMEAMARMKVARPCASPSPNQIEAFLRWVSAQQVRAPSWEDLARIAYSRSFTSARDATV